MKNVMNGKKLDENDLEQVSGGTDWSSLGAEGPYKGIITACWDNWEYQVNVEGFGLRDALSGDFENLKVGTSVDVVCMAGELFQIVNVY